MNCAVCHMDLVDGDRIIAYVHEKFVFKPAHVQDTVNPAKVSAEELLESRKEHTRTAIAKIFGFIGKEPLPEGAFNVRHDYCDVLRTGESSNGAHPITKHAVRYQRSMTKRGSK